MEPPWAAHALSRFALQIFLLIVFMCITLLIASLICLTLPGRTVSSLFASDIMSRCFVVKGRILPRCDLLSDIHLKLFPPHFWSNLGCWSMEGWVSIPLDSSALEQRGTKSRYNLWFGFGNKVLWPFSFLGHGLITVWVFRKSSLWLKSFFQASLLVLICCPYYVVIVPVHCMAVLGDLCEARRFRFVIWYSQVFIFKFQLNNVS